MKPFEFPITNGPLSAKTEAQSDYEIWWSLKKEFSFSNICSSMHFVESWRQKRSCSKYSFIAWNRKKTMSWTSFSLVVFWSDCELKLSHRFITAIVCLRTSSKISWIHRLMVSFHKGSAADLLEAVSLHNIVAISTAANLFNLIPAERYAFARGTVLATKNETRTTFLWVLVSPPQTAGRAILYSLYLVFFLLK